MATMIGLTLRAWGVGLAAVAAGGAGLTALTAGSPVTSLPRMGFAAAVLAAYTATVAIVVTDRASRSRGRCLVWGAAVPTMVGLINAGAVTAAAGAAQGLVSAFPWFVGALAVSVFGPQLPQIRLPARLRGSHVRRS
jgi:hypothetical protein